MFGPSRIEKALAAEVEYLRHLLERAHERIDRLTEAVSHKSDIPLVMPQTPVNLPEFVGHQPLEKSAGWFDKHAIPALPPKKPSGGSSK